MAAQPEVRQVVKLHAVKSGFFRLLLFRCLFFRVLRGFHRLRLRTVGRRSPQKQRPGQKQRQRNNSDHRDRADPAEFFVLERRTFKGKEDQRTQHDPVQNGRQQIPVGRIVSFNADRAAVCLGKQDVVGRFTHGEAGRVAGRIQ